MTVITILSIGLPIAIYWLFTIDLTLTRRQKLILVLVSCGGLLTLSVVFSPGVIIDALVGTRNIWLGVFTLGCTAYAVSFPFSLLFPDTRQQIVFVTLVMVVLTSVYAAFNGLAVPRVKEIRVSISKLPEGLEGFTIVQLSDLHLGGGILPNWWEGMVKKVNGLKPQIVVITGDLTRDIKIEEAERRVYAEMLKQIKSPNGVVAVSGNHDVRSGDENFVRITRAAGIEVLDNRVIRVAGGIQVAGIPDPTAPEAGGEKPDLYKALKSADPLLPLILLSHRPEYFRAARGYGIDMQLSGHTHAGQLPPNDLIVNILYDHPYGLYKEGNSYIYTSCGTGVFGLPMRLFSRNEIVKIVLIR